MSNMLSILATEDINVPQSKLIVWYNNKAYHALPSYVNSIHNAMLRSMVKNNSLDRQKMFGISTFSHPLRITTGQIDTTSL